MEELSDRLRTRREFEKLRGRDVIIVIKKRVSSFGDTPLIGEVVKVDEDKASIDTKGFMHFGGGGGMGEIETISFNEVEEVAHFD